MMFRKHKKIWVTASDAGSTAFCPHSVQLKYLGVEVDRQAQLARAAGRQAHAELNATVDKRCYVATSLYGAADPRTSNLRTYRDEVLAKSMVGKILIETYYLISPHLVEMAERSPLLKWLVRRTLDLLIGKGDSR